VRQEDPKKNGCPLDRDQDGIVDADDACPLAPGVRDPDPRRNGCPPDRDGDGIVDADDACPRERGPRDPDPKKNGCPTLVRVTELIREEVVDIERPLAPPVEDPRDRITRHLRERFASDQRQRATVASAWLDRRSADSPARPLRSIDNGSGRILPLEWTESVRRSRSDNSNTSTG